MKARDLVCSDERQEESFISMARRKLENIEILVKAENVKKLLHNSDLLEVK